MKRNVILIAATFVILFSCDQRVARAQSEELQKFEIGAQFSSLSVSQVFGTRTEPGFGGRFTYNLTDDVALEAEGNFFPRSDQFHAPRTGGRAVQGLFGIKIGRRYKRFGFFGKAGPGLISFSEAINEFIPTTAAPDPFSQITIRHERLTHFTADIGGVLEFYPSRRIFTRIDVGDTIIHYGKATVNNLSVGSGGQFIFTPFTIPSDTTHNFQFSAGVGFRF